jgi:hypothetical protein
MQAMRLADGEAEALVMQARPLAFTERAWGAGTSPEEIEKIVENDQRRREKALRKFKNALLEREADAYLKAQTALSTVKQSVLTTPEALFCCSLC